MGRSLSDRLKIDPVMDAARHLNSFVETSLPISVRVIEPPNQVEHIAMIFFGLLLFSIVTSGPARACGQVTIAPLSEEEVNALFSMQGAFRLNIGGRVNPRITPAASDTEIIILEWDDEMAKIAQTLANQCADGHDSCRDVERFFVGRNIAFSKVFEGDPIPTVLEQMKILENELRVFNSDYVSSYGDDISYAEYRQLVWGNITHLGCGRIVYEAADSKIVTLICNYGVAGNVDG